MRVIFDRSSITADKLESLLEAGLREAERVGRIQVWHAPVTLEEMIVMRQNPARRTQLTREWNVIRDLGVGNWFRCLGGPGEQESGHCYRELVLGKGLDELPMSAEECLDLRRQIDAFAAGGLDDHPEMEEVRGQQAANTGKNEMLHVGSRGLRAKPREEKLRLLALAGEKRFSEYVENKLIDFGRKLIPCFLYNDPSSGQAVASWTRAPALFPITTFRIVGRMFIMWYAAFHCNSPLDKNAQIDTDFLTYSLAADICVSDDVRFLASCFEEVYARRPCKLLTARKFADEILMHS